MGSHENRINITMATYLIHINFILSTMQFISKYADICVEKLI